MVQPWIGNLLYEEASQMAAHTPAMGSKLAGNCVTVHFGMLRHARQLLGPTVQFTIGHIQMGDRDRFDFTDQELADWISGKTKVRYNLHAWLSSDSDLIDLTLAPTIYEIDASLIPKGITYLDRALAMSCGITHVPRVTGDNLPMKLGLFRS